MSYPRPCGSKRRQQRLATTSGTRRMHPWAEAACTAARRAASSPERPRRIETVLRTVGLLFRLAIFNGAFSRNDFAGDAKYFESLSSDRLLGKYGCGCE